MYVCLLMSDYLYRKCELSKGLELDKQSKVVTWINWQRFFLLPHQLGVCQAFYLQTKMDRFLSFKQ